MLTYNDLYVEKYRPTTFEEMVLTDDVRQFFTNIFSQDNPVIPNLLLYGRAGGGKSTLAMILRQKLGWETLRIKASEENGIDAIRTKVSGFVETKSIVGSMKLIILEEADGLSKDSGKGTSAQQVLKNLIEDNSARIRFIMTCNDVSKIDEAIKSRMEEFFIRPPDPYKNNEILKYVIRVMKSEGIGVDDVDDLKDLVYKSYPDIRKTLNVLQQYSNNPEHKFSPNVTIVYQSDRIADDIITALNKKNIDDASLTELRKHVMDNERLFDGNHYILMRSMLERIAKEPPRSVTGFDKKRSIVCLIYEYMCRCKDAIDSEIHMYALIVNLSMIWKP